MQYSKYYQKYTTELGVEQKKDKEEGEIRERQSEEKQGLNIERQINNFFSQSLNILPILKSGQAIFF